MQTTSMKITHIALFVRRVRDADLGSTSGSRQFAPVQTSTRPPPFFARRVAALSEQVRRRTANVRNRSLYLISLRDYGHEAQ
jgi:hypothetical protein